jgi:hypothetical protein
MTSEETLINFARAVGLDIKSIKNSMGSLSDFEIVNPLESDLIQYKSGK